MPFLVMIVLYFGEVDSHPVPTALCIALVGIALGWAEGVVDGQGVEDALDFVKFTGVETGFDALGDWSEVGSYIGIIVSLAVQSSAGTVMNVGSAKLCGDEFDVRAGMATDGLASAVSAMFGSPFLLSSYVGYPAYKKANAGNGYAMLNAITVRDFHTLSLSRLSLVSRLSTLTIPVTY